MNELTELIIHEREERNLEYKGSMNWSSNTTKAKVTKSVLAMSNIKDGGYLVLGVDEGSDDVWTANGMSENDFESYNQDHVSAHIANYADPFAEITVSKQIYDEKRFVIIQVLEFQELPVICKRDGAENLTNGVIYTRTRRMFESAPVQSQTEMREIIEMAVDKSNDVFSVRINAIIQNAVNVGNNIDIEKSDSLFEKQLGEI